MPDDLDEVLNKGSCVSTAPLCMVCRDLALPRTMQADDETSPVAKAICGGNAQVGHGMALGSFLGGCTCSANVSRARFLLGKDVDLLLPGSAGWLLWMPNVTDFWVILMLVGDVPTAERAFACWAASSSMPSWFPKACTVRLPGARRDRACCALSMGTFCSMHDAEVAWRTGFAAGCEVDGAARD